MKKMFSLSQRTCERITEIAKRETTSQSSLVETAINIYIMIYYGDPKNARKISEQLQDAQAQGQLDMLDQLFNKH